ncbi:unknown [Spodoptera litura nucleopolyhedrovirus]|uniref:Uncharacterized protein n=1 Tax=Spodoptera litura multicapsid nucleopolyhedrovirus TaxID=46242 RepID=Q91BC3_NPVST|nr:hypothetical protein [Spodoptera litura nucleopolyhedrovirus]AAL01788.1 unknown [Spodoptera litura nucleopolyhedrovirus]QHN73955.1 hypothetical protein [Spodoptera litura nucleopolyhedrovirus]UQV25642.1 hypothetical protein [Spodoptera litura nucleopolyhedrovirus]WML75170.1 hypothetical protein KBIHDJOI_00128 [Spodoptera littoralis nucleopolyhedrovirus]
MGNLLNKLFRRENYVFDKTDSETTNKSDLDDFEKIDSDSSGADNSGDDGDDEKDATICTDESYEIDESNMFDESITTLEQKIEKAREIFTQRFERFGYDLKFDGYDDTDYGEDYDNYCCEHHPNWYLTSKSHCFYSVSTVVKTVEKWYKELHRRGGFENLEDFVKVFHATLPVNVYVAMFDVDLKYWKDCYVCDAKYQYRDNHVYPLKMCFCSECATQLFYERYDITEKIVKSFCTCSKTEFVYLNVLREIYCITCKRVKIFKYIYN